MAKRWQLIDDDGSRDVLVDHQTGRVVSGFKVAHEHCEWPPFTQTAIAAPLQDVTTALEEVAREFDLPCHPIQRAAPGNDHTVSFAQADELTLIGEPGIEFDARFVSAASTEALVEHLETRALHVGHDPSTGSLHLTKFLDGSPVFSWCDSLEPGPSFALEFHDDGRCTEQDPREFAIERMDLEYSSEDYLNRRAFMARELKDFGLESIDPDFQETDATAAFAVDIEEYRTPISS
jgi:hypothetical protein